MASDEDVTGLSLPGLDLNDTAAIADFISELWVLITLGGAAVSKWLALRRPIAFGGELMKSDEALQTLADRLDVVVGSSNVGLRDALGRILSADIRSEMAVPPHDNAAVDGYAVRFSDLAAGDDTRLKIIGRVAAAKRLPIKPGAGETIRIFTGAAMPPDADTVLMQEDCREEDGEGILQG